YLGKAHAVRSAWQGNPLDDRLNCIRRPKGVIAAQRPSLRPVAMGRTMTLPRATARGPDALRPEVRRRDAWRSHAPSGAFDRQAVSTIRIDRIPNAAVPAPLRRTR